MHTYIIVNFWLNLFIVVVNILFLATNTTWPMRSQFTLGECVARVLSCALFAGWAAFLLWGMGQ